MVRSDTGNLEALTSIALSELGVNMSTRILAAVSGGADSVTMATVLARINEKNQFGGLGIIHINHSLRDGESDGDEAHVKKVADSLGVTLHSFKVDTNARSKEKGIGIEEAARDDRYDRFIEVAKAHRYDMVVTAHTANDNLESVLHNLIRGTGLKGLRGIPPKRALTDMVDVIRPWLDIEREDVLLYAKENGIEFRNDSSNDSLQFTRNRLRHIVVPALQQSFPDRNIFDGFRRTMKNIGDMTTQFEENVRIMTKWCQIELPDTYVRRDAYASMEFAIGGGDDAFRRAFIIEVLEKYLREPLTISLDSLQTMIIRGFLDDEKRTELLLTSEILLTKEEVERPDGKDGYPFADEGDYGDMFDDELEEHFEDNSDEDDNNDEDSPSIFSDKDTAIVIERLRPLPDDWQTELIVGEEIETSIGMIESKFISGRDVEFVSGNAYFDMGVLGERKLILRRWQEGDKMKPFGMEGHTKLVSDILNEASVTSYHKKMCIVLVFQDEPEHILWVPGLRAADIAPVTSRTETVLSLERIKIYPEPLARTKGFGAMF
jgi:tRNA(Ile)-lysidine synthetase-like protein